jgi:hypothetical protein
MARKRGGEWANGDEGRPDYLVVERQLAAKFVSSVHDTGSACHDARIDDLGSSVDGESSWALPWRAEVEDAVDEAVKEACVILPDALKRPV